MGNAAAPVARMEDWLARDGFILRADPAQEAALGLAPGALSAAPWSQVYPLTARERLADQFDRPGAAPQLLALEMRGPSGALIPVTALVERVEAPEGLCLRVTKWPAGGALGEVARLSEENEILASILAASDDAGWCMEWAEPVDLSAPEQEIIRQVFENAPRWRFCNDAMARLYRTPPECDFNDLPVHETFPRTRENEEFIRRLVRANFDVNGSPSRDLRYDGVYIEVENDVRGHIRGNRLYRMWGTARDVSKHARRAAVLRDEIETLEAILAALPEAVLVVDRAGRLLRVNLAAEELLDLVPETLAARELAELVVLPVTLDELFALVAQRLPGHPDRVLPVTLPRRAGAPRAEICARPLRLRECDCLILSLRLRLAPVGEPMPGRVAQLRTGG